MPLKAQNPSKNTEDEKNIAVQGGAINSNIVIGDNSSLRKPVQAGQLLGESPQAIPTTDSKLIPFLCYAKENSIEVREFRERLRAEYWVDPWFDEEDILPGQKWEESVTEAVHNSHAVIIFLSFVAVRTEGFFQKELKLALDAAAEKPEKTIFIIPIRLDNCDVPERLLLYQYVDYFGDEAHKNHVYSSLIAALKIRAGNLGIKT